MSGLCPNYERPVSRLATPHRIMMSNITRKYDLGITHIKKRKEENPQVSKVDPFPNGEQITK